MGTYFSEKVTFFNAKTLKKVFFGFSLKKVSKKQTKLAFLFGKFKKLL